MDAPKIGIAQMILKHLDKIYCGCAVFLLRRPHRLLPVDPLLSGARPAHQHRHLADRLPVRRWNEQRAELWYPVSNQSPGPDNNYRMLNHCSTVHQRRHGAMENDSFVTFTSGECLWWTLQPFPPITFTTIRVLSPSHLSKGLNDIM